MFTYKIYFSSIEKEHYLRLTPSQEFRKRFGTATNSLFDISNTIIVLRNIPMIRVTFDDRLINNRVAYEVIKFYIDSNIGKYISIKYNKSLNYWTCHFKIINKSLLLELL